MKPIRSRRISRRAIRNFLQLAAAAFAFSAELPLANANELASASGNSRSVKRAQAPARKSDLRPYQHTFALTGPDAEYPAQVTVAPIGNKSVLRGVLHAPGRLGPLPDGAYTVAIETRSDKEVQLVRIGPDTDRYLNFLVAEEQA